MKNTMTINPNEVRKHIPNEMHMRAVLMGSHKVKPKKGKGSYTRKMKHKVVY